MLNRLQGCLLACALGMTVAVNAEAQESTVDNDVACSTACAAVNGLDRTIQGWPSVQSTSQGMVDQARDFVNDVCSDSCQKPAEPWRDE